MSYLESKKEKKKQKRRNKKKQSFIKAKIFG